MASTLSLSAGTVQILFSNSSSPERWHPKRFLSSRSAMMRGSPLSTMDKAAVRSPIPLGSLDSVFGRRRKPGLGPEAGCPSRIVFTAAVEESIAVSESSAAPVKVSESEEDNMSEIATVSVVPLPIKAERFKPRVPGQKARREDPTVPGEALVEGAVFTGKVTTIQSFGAFVNFGAFTDGLVHISKMSTGYVSNVSDIVSLGQEVKVTIISVEQNSGRIALSMVDKEGLEAKDAIPKAGEAREGNERPRFQQGPDGRPVNRGRIAGGGRQNRRDEPQKSLTKLTKGNEVEGTVKNKIRAGVFVELPENDEGFLRYSDIPGGENMAPESSLQIGEKINATVLRIDRGKILLTMKPIVDVSSVNRDINKGRDSGATNPFEIAFRAFNLIPAEGTSPFDGDVASKETEAAVDVEDSPVDEQDVVLEALVPVDEEAPPAEEDRAAMKVTVAPEEIEAAVDVEESPVAEQDVVPEALVPVDEEAPPAEEVQAAMKVTVALEEIEAAVDVEESPVAEQDVVPGALVPVDEEAPPAEEDQAAMKVTVALEEIEAAVDVEDSPVAEQDVVPEALVPVDEEARPLEEDQPGMKVTVAPEEIEGGVDVGESPVAEQDVVPEALVPADGEAPHAEEDSAAMNVTVAMGEIEAAVDAEKSPVAEQKDVREALVPADEEAPPAEEERATMTVTEGVSAGLVKKLRDETGAGMMDCKRALTDTGGDIEKAREALRKKGLASADKKASRIASEGLIGSYIHDSRIGVVIEVNCETDFVSRGQAFKSLVQDLGMQVVASQQVEFVSVEDVPAEIVSKEREMEAQKEDLVDKPKAIRGKIIEGRVNKRLSEIALLEQPYIRDDKVSVKDLVKQTVSALGENIKVRRFERYVLGEGLQKRGTDFAAEVAAQTGVKAPSEPLKTEEAPASTPTSGNGVVVPAALVKDLRDQTGAGMMDCKKALASTENDVEKAVEFLRKKGLSSADKKANRLASEGLIGTYIHDGRIGVLVEVNCETDFVARGEKFKELVEDLAMQIAAYPQIQVVSKGDVPAEMVAKEVELESGKEDLSSRPEAIRARIVEGRVAKRVSELALLEQPFVKDDKKLVKDVLKETIASLGENIQVRRFTRFSLGEGLEKRSVDFASEVAAQAGVKA